MFTKTVHSFTECNYRGCFVANTVCIDCVSQKPIKTDLKLGATDTTCLTLAVPIALLPLSVGRVTSRSSLRSHL